MACTTDRPAFSVPFNFPPGRLYGLKRKKEKPEGEKKRSVLTASALPQPHTPDLNLRPFTYSDPRKGLPCSPVLRRGKCSGASVGRLGTAGRKLLSTERAAPSVSKGSRVLWGKHQGYFRSPGCPKALKSDCAQLPGEQPPTKQLGSVEPACQASSPGGSSGSPMLM